MINWEDIEDGALRRVGWATSARTRVLAVATRPAPGRRRSRSAKDREGDRQAVRRRARLRSARAEMQRKMHDEGATARTRRSRCSRATDDGISISGERVGRSTGGDAPARLGEDPDLPRGSRHRRQMQRARWSDIAGHKTAPHDCDQAEARGLVPRHARGAAPADRGSEDAGRRDAQSVSRRAAIPGIQRLAASVNEDIVVHSPRGRDAVQAPTARSCPIPTPKDFSGDEQPLARGALWGAGGRRRRARHVRRRQ